jgi:hypothetical protein
LLLLTTVPAWSDVDPGPLERHVKRIESGIHSLGRQSYTRHNSTGHTTEQYVVKAGSVTDYQYASDGTLQTEWTLRPNGSLTYEAFYGRRRTKERLLEDDRTVSYSSYYRNGRKWEAYLRNKQKGLRAYYVYDQSGHQLHNDI